MKFLIESYNSENNVHSSLVKMFKDHAGDVSLTRVTISNVEYLIYQPNQNLSDSLVDSENDEHVSSPRHCFMNVAKLRQFLANIAGNEKIIGTHCFERPISKNSTVMMTYLAIASFCPNTHHVFIRITGPSLSKPACYDTDTDPAMLFLNMLHNKTTDLKQMSFDFDVLEIDGAIHLYTTVQFKNETAITTFKINRSAIKSGSFLETEQYDGRATVKIIRCDNQQNILGTVKILEDGMHTYIGDNQGPVQTLRNPSEWQDRSKTHANFTTVSLTGSARQMLALLTDAEGSTIDVYSDQAWLQLGTIPKNDNMPHRIPQVITIAPKVGQSEEIFVLHKSVQGLNLSMLALWPKRLVPITTIQLSETDNTSMRAFQLYRLGDSRDNIRLRITILGSNGYQHHTLHIPKAKLTLLDQLWDLQYETGIEQATIAPLANDPHALLAASELLLDKAACALIKNGAKLDVVDPEGQSLIHILTKQEKTYNDEVITILRALAAKKANLDAKNQEGKPASLYLVQAEKAELLDCLLSLGADVNYQGEDKRSLFQLALAKQSKDVLTVLCRYQAKAFTSGEHNKALMDLGINIFQISQDQIRALTTKVTELQSQSSEQRAQSLGDTQQILTQLTHVQAVTQETAVLQEQNVAPALQQLEARQHAVAYILYGMYQINSDLCRNNPSVPPEVRDRASDALDYLGNVIADVDGGRGAIEFFQRQHQPLPNPAPQQQVNDVPAVPRP